jgi:putative transposase
MTQYRRASIPGATWFFTVNLAEPNGNRLLVDEVDTLRSAFRTVQATHSFRIDAAVILPDHLHCIWTLPPRDSDFSTRWGLIKGNFSRAIQKGERLSPSQIKRGERGLWQRRFWEHLIRDEDDFRHHTDYIHWNPVKRGWVQKVWIGRIPAFMAIYDAVCMKRIGVMWGVTEIEAGE